MEAFTTARFWCGQQTPNRIRATAIAESFSPTSMLLAAERTRE